MFKFSDKKLVKAKLFKLVSDGRLPKCMAMQAFIEFRQTGQLEAIARFFRQNKEIVSNGTHGGFSPQEMHFRESVFLRDEYKCVHCGSTKRLEVDHIKPRAIYPDLIYDIDNGRTLCHGCHLKTETYGGKIRRIVAVSVEAV